MPVLAIDFGGTKIKTGVVENGNILTATSMNASSSESIEKNISDTVQRVRTFLEKENINKNAITGIGIALPVIVDSINNRVLTQYVKYRDAKDFNFKAWFKNNWDIPLQLENDARAALVGEWQYGAGRGCNDLVMLTLGTGVGSAVLTNGQLLKGKHYLAGNMTGHTIINADGVACNCGSKGCLETEAASWALPAIAKRINRDIDNPLAKKEDLDFESLINALDCNNDFAKEVFNHCVNTWGICAANLVHSFDPEKIIISGGIMKSADRILPVIQQYVDTHTWLEPGSVQVVTAEQPDFAALTGMEYLVTNKFFN
ncbi:MAG TPA: ROK family protein [Niabella sp.]|nr:ROK family protein [Niabella sp.]